MSGSESVIITLPLPSPDLSPNKKLHWTRKHHATQVARQFAYSKGSGYMGQKFSGYQLHFFWPDKRRRDQDNASASCKAYLDGFSDYIGQDDSEWNHNGVRFHTDKEKPRLEIHFEKRN